MVKPVPVIVADTPPPAGPDVGDTPVTVGVYVNLSFGAFMALVPALVVTVTSTGDVPAGDVATIVVSVSTTTPVPGVAPKLTPVAPVKPVPVIVTAVPPLFGPPLGESEVTVGTGKLMATVTGASLARYNVNVHEVCVVPSFGVKTRMSYGKVPRSTDNDEPSAASAVPTICPGDVYKPSAVGSHASLSGNV